MFNLRAGRNGASALRLRVEPASLTQLVAGLRSEAKRSDGEDDREERDGTAEAIDERSPAAEHGDPSSLDPVGRVRPDRDAAVTCGR